MFTRKLSDHLYIIDLKPVGIENYIASYVLRGADSTAIIETLKKKPLTCTQKCLYLLCFFSLISKVTCLWVKKEESTVDPHPECHLKD